MKQTCSFREKYNVLVSPESCRGKASFSAAELSAPAAGLSECNLGMGAARQKTNLLMSAGVPVATTSQKTFFKFALFVVAGWQQGKTLNQPAC